VIEVEYNECEVQIRGDTLKILMVIKLLLYYQNIKCIMYLINRMKQET